MKIGIIGSGNVGITSAFAIAEKNSADIVLYGRTPGRAQGKALDLAEAAPIRRYDVRIDGTDSFEAVTDADVIVLAAGKPRTAGMSRFDLLDDNLPFIQGLADRLAEAYQGQEPPVTVVLSEPVDLMTLAFAQRTGWPRRRVIGVGGSLSASRLRHFVARELSIAPADVDAMVVGTHGDAMVVLERYCRISGLPLAQFLSPDQISQVMERTKQAGTEIVEQAKVGSSFYTPGAAVAELVQAITRNSNRVLLTSTILDGKYGVKGQAVTVPAKVGASGIKQVYELDLTEAEKEAFRRSVDFQQPYLKRFVS
jgi:malate dehydrogenase